MHRERLLTWGHTALGITFVTFALSAIPGGGMFLVPGLLIGTVGAGLIAFSREDLPRWGGLTILGYILVTFVVFLASTSLTVRLGGSNYFLNDQPSPFLDAVVDYLVLGIPLLFVAASAVAVWERGWPRWVMLGALAGLLLLAILTIASTPGEPTGDDPSGQTSPLASLFALVGLIAATGAFGAAWAYRKEQPTEA